MSKHKQPSETVEQKPTDTEPKEVCNEQAAIEPELEPGTEETAEDAKEQSDAKTYTLTAEEFETAKTHIATLQKEKEDTIALLQRNQADFDNYRRRNASIRADSYEEGKRDCIKALLPVLDNFDRAMATESAGDEGWRSGIQMVHKQLLDLLQKQGLCEVEADGKFDPNLHEAVMQEAAEGKESGTILMVLQKGYRVGDKIIRHSMVKVAQ